MNITVNLLAALIGTLLVSPAWGQIVKAEVEKFARLAKAAGIKPE